MAANTELLKWQRFFLAAGIPGTIAAKYAKSFDEQRVQFAMLDELDKSTLVELGVKTVGDQIAIFRHIRKMKGSQNEPMDCTVSATKPVSNIKDKKASSAAPDRDDIYHIRLPVGATPKTRAILRKHNLMKSAGLLKRGSNGIRQSGKEIAPSMKPRNTSRTVAVGNMTNDTSVAASTEVSSTTDDFYGRMGIKGLVSDQLQAPKTTTRMSWKSASLFERAVNESAANRLEEPVIRVRISGLGNKVMKQRGRIVAQVRANRSGAIRKHPSQIVQFVRNDVGSRLNNSKIRGRIRPSVFDRLS